MMVRLLYASRCPHLAADAVENILLQSRTHNPSQGITGVLCHGGDVFMQVLEGGRDSVNRLYHRIVCDTRHRDVVMLQYEEIAERRFTNWSMGQVNLAKINPSTILKYSERPVLDPFTVSGQASMAILLDLIATASVVGRAP